MDNLLREKITQLTSKCDVLQKNVQIKTHRVNLQNVSILWSKLSASKRVFMESSILNLIRLLKNYASI